MKTKHETRHMHIYIYFIQQMKHTFQKKRKKENECNVQYNGVLTHLHNITHAKN